MSDTLAALQRSRSAAGSPPPPATSSAEAYRFLRTVEHRLQMVADEQTQTLPEDARQARWGSPASAALPMPPPSPQRLTAELERCRRHYVRLFEHSPELTRGGANMVFAGESDDPGTVEALTRMGYTRAPEIIAPGARLASRPLPGRAQRRVPASC